MSSSLDLHCLIAIAEHLSLGDIKAMRSVCKSWYTAVSVPQYFKNAVINITGTLNSGQKTNQSLEEQYTYLMNSEVLHLVQSVCYRNAGRKVDEFTNEFWTTFGPQIKSLKFQNVVFESDREVQHVLSVCPNLTELKFENCISFSTKPPSLETNFNLDKLESISFVRTNFSEYLYKQLQENIGPIIHLVFDCCLIRDDDYSPDQYQEEMVWLTMVQEGSYHTGGPVDMAQQFMYHHAKSLKSAVLSKIVIFDFNIVYTLQAEGMSLRKFHLKQRMSPSSFDCLRTNQPTLEDLAIDSYWLEQHCLIDIKEWFPALTHLDLSLRKTDLHILFSCLPQMTHIKYLELNISTRDVENLGQPHALTSESFPTGLKVLKCLNLPIYFTGIDPNTPALPVNLQVLKLRCPDTVVDTLVQNICKWLHELQVLDLSGCSKVTDKGLVGTCGSATSQNIEQGKEFSIGSLRNLEVLILSGCDKMTDESIRTMNFTELRELNLSECKLITDKGFSSLGARIPSLEVLHMRHCRITNDGLINFLKGVPRLRVLNALDCHKLTKASIDAVAKFCPLMRNVTMNSLFSVKAAFDSLKDRLPRCAIATDEPGLFVSRPGYEDRVYGESDFFGESDSSDSDNMNMFNIQQILNMDEEMFDEEEESLEDEDVSDEDE